MVEYPTDLDPRDLEPQYSRHVGALTSEGLHHKSDIAIQLAWRDKTIADLRNQRDELIDRFDREKLDHEVTKGYRQHAELL
ncbi:MAG TPA: hypothetical protein VK571_06370, partial [Gemmatimonadaceae bacterium]|nr:hypothetical protein [Gemmatimonadaceae bacterium]